MAEDLPSPDGMNHRAVRYHTALRRAVLRRRRGAPSFVEQWGWLLPRLVWAFASGLGAVLLDARGAEPAALLLPAPPPPTLPLIEHFPQEAEPVVVVISKTAMFVNEDKVMDLPAHDALVEHGVASPAEGMLIPALAEAIAHARKSAARPPQEAVIVADAGTPYRLLTEVLYTLGWSEIGKYHFMVRSGRKKK